MRGLWWWVLLSDRTGVPSVTCTRAFGGGQSCQAVLCIALLSPACGGDFRTRIRVIRHLPHGAQSCVAACAGGHLPSLPGEVVEVAERLDREERGRGQENRYRRRRGAAVHSLACCWSRSWSAGRARGCHQLQWLMIVAWSLLHRLHTGVLYLGCCYRCYSCLRLVLEVWCLSRQSLSFFVSAAVDAGIGHT